MTVVALLSPDRSAVVMRAPATGWQVVFPVADLPRWIGFYERLRDRKGGQFARFFADDLAALAGVQADLRRGQA